MTLTKQGTGAGLVAGPKTIEGGTMGNLVDVKITRTTMAGGSRVEAGKTATVTQADARALIAMGKAVPVAQEAPKADNRDEAVTTDASKRSNAKKKSKEG